MYKCYVFCAVNFHKNNIAVVWIKLDKYDISKALMMLFIIIQVTIS